MDKIMYQECNNNKVDIGSLLELVQISDTVSESSDNGTILSLSRDDLRAFGAGPLREDVRVSRKKLETLILNERDDDPKVTKGYMDTLMDNTNTYIQWPSRMKIGAKTKKDLFVRILGHSSEDIDRAKCQILEDLGPQRDLRITLKMEISYTDHSHLIGCRGATIRKVMEDTGCHIHFPDSNRMSKEQKSNQVTIAGSSVLNVEEARSRVRELSPLVFQFNLPVIHSRFDLPQMSPDANNVFIDNIQTSFNVQVTVHPPNKLQQTTISVKGCEVDAPQIKEAVVKIINYFAAGTPVSAIIIESTMEITPIQHAFVRTVNDSNIHAIMMGTGAKIIFPDLSDDNIQQIKRSRIYITGELNSVYYARQQLIGCLPLRMIFDLSESFDSEWETIRLICSGQNVNAKFISRNRMSMSNGLNAIPPPVAGRGRTIQLTSAERNAGSIYEARRQILGGTDPPMDSKIPPTYMLQHIQPHGILHFGAHLAPPPGSLLLPSSPNMLSPLLSPSFWPPTPFSSPFQLSPQPHHMALNANLTPVQNRMGYSYSLLHHPAKPLHHGMEQSVGTMGMNLSPLVAPQPAPLSQGGRGGQYHHAPPIMNLVPQFELHHTRRAPGFERSNTNPNLAVSPGGEGQKGNYNEKKFMAMKAMYQAKMSPGARVPNGEWSGYGFSKTQPNLFASGGGEHGSPGDGDDEEEGSPIGTGAIRVWAKGEEQQIVDDNNNEGEKGTLSMTKQGNALDSPTASSSHLDIRGATDIPSLFTPHGLEKHIDKFLMEEVDLDTFKSFNEEDLRKLDVTSYAARKKMLLLIFQLKMETIKQETALDVAA